MHLVFVPSLRHWQAFLAKPLLPRDELVIATCDLHVLDLARSNGFQSADLTDYLVGSKIEANRQQAWALSQTWFEPYWGELTCAGVNLAEVARNFMVFPFATILNASSSWAQLIGHLSPTRISLFELEGIPVDWAWRSHSDIPSICLMHVAEELAVPWQFVCAGAVEPPSVRKDVVQREDVPAAEGQKGTMPLLIVMGGGRDYRDQQRLAAGLVATGDWSILHVHIGMPPVLESSNGLVPWQTLTGLPWAGELVQAEIDEGWSRFETRESAGWTAIFDDPRLLYQFETYVEYLRAMAAVTIATDVLIDTYKPAGLVVNNDIHDLRAAVAVARNREVLTIQFIHGGIAHLEIYDFTTDLMVVWGRAQRRKLVEFGRPAERIVRGGNYNFVKPNRPAKQVRDRRRALCNSLGIDESIKIILLITAQLNLGLTIPRSSLSRHISAWVELEAVARRRTDVAMLVKPHPVYDHPEFYRSLGEAGQGRLHVLDAETSIFELLPLCDAAVLVNSPTTAGLEAMLFEKPVAYIRNAMFDVPGYRTALDASGVIWIDDLESLEMSLLELVSDCPARAKTLALGREFVEDFISLSDSKALEKSIEIVGQHISNRRGRADSLDIDKEKNDVTVAMTNSMQRKALSVWRDQHDSKVGQINPLSAWQIMAWMLAGPARPAGNNMHNTLRDLFAATPRAQRPALSERFRVYAHLQHALSFESVLAGHRVSAFRYRLRARAWRAAEAAARWPENYMSKK